jgi:hypothetical protein
MQSSQAGEEMVVSVQQGPFAQRLSGLLQTIPATVGEQPYELDELSLLLGLRLPDVAQTVTFWHRGETGRAMRRLGFGVRVELNRVIFVRRTSG